MKTLFPLFTILIAASNFVFAQSTFYKVYQSSPFDQECLDALPTADGGYLLAGMTTNSTLNDMNVYVIKVDSNGDTLWTKRYGGNKPEYIYHMLETADGNYFLIGYSQSFGAGDYDTYLLKIDPNGALLWSKTYGGTGNEEGREIIKTTDGNYMIVGYSNSSTPSKDAFLMKIDPAGTVIWTKYYGGSNMEYGKSVKQSPDGGYFMLGQTYSYGVNGDAYLVKTNSIGDTLWTRIYGGGQTDEGNFLTANSDGSAVFLVRDSSTTPDIDVRVIKTDASGSIVWNKVYGGTKKDTPKMIQPTSDGGYIVGAISRSFGWIKPDMWLLKLDAAGDTSWTRHYGGGDNEHCYSAKQLSDGSFIAVGKTESYGPDMDVIFLKLNQSGQLVGVEEHSSAVTAVKIFPNPSKGDLTLDWVNFKPGKVKITDMLGREIFRLEKLNEDKIVLDLRSNPAGVYFIHCESNGKTVTSKFILD